jgi:hypothetical protein
MFVLSVFIRVHPWPTEVFRFKEKSALFGSSEQGARFVEIIFRVTGQTKMGSQESFT